MMKNDVGNPNSDQTSFTRWKMISMVLVAILICVVLRDVQSLSAAKRKHESASHALIVLQSRLELAVKNKVDAVKYTPVVVAWQKDVQKRIQELEQQLESAKISLIEVPRGCVQVIVEKEQQRATELEMKLEAVREELAKLKKE